MNRTVLRLIPLLFALLLLCGCTQEPPSAQNPRTHGLP